jgi:uncharacterized protein YkwD
MSGRVASLIVIIALSLLIVSAVLIVHYGIPALNMPYRVSTVNEPIQATGVQRPVISAPTPLQMPAAVAAIADAINQERAKAGLTGLKLNMRLSTAAQSLLQNPNADPAQAVSEQGYYHTDLWSSAVTGSEDGRTAAQELLITFRTSILNPAQRDIGIASEPAGDSSQFVILIGSEEVLTAPGADILEPGEPSQTGQAESILQLVNGARASQGIAPLRINAQLMQAAAAHSADQAHQDVLAHEGSDGSSPSDRAERTGYPSRFVGENILSRGTLHAAGAFDQWWNSPGHHDNMLNPAYSEVGIAYDRSATTGSYYYTMLLGSP